MDKTYQIVETILDKNIAAELCAMKLKTLNETEIKITNIDGRFDGYMYKDFGTLSNIPVLMIDGRLWMSITPMEVQSHYMPILLASGVVGVGGLGLGYYVQRILNKKDVCKVIVYETNQDVIDLYYKNFGVHPKLEIIAQDVLSIKNMEFDFFYNDIYPGLLDDNVMKDMYQI